MRRRDLLKIGAAAGVGATLPSGCRTPATERGSAVAAGGRWARDLALVNGSVVTMEADQPRAEAVLVSGGRIALVGSNAAVSAAAGAAPVFDAGGRGVVPGFVDAHVHFEMACNARAYQVACHTPPATSLREIKAALRSKAAESPAGRWIIGRGSFGMASRVEEGRLPDRHELDAITGEHPLILYAGFHVAMVNTRGLRELGLWDSDDAAPRGAIVHRDAGGDPTGIATEIWTLPPAYTVAEVEAALRAHASELFVAKGITSIQTLPLAGTDLLADQAVQASGELPIRLRAYYHVPHLFGLDDFLATGLQSGFGDDMFRFGGVKIFVDGAGSDGLGTALADFKWTQPELDEFVLRAHTAGVQLMMHVVTDAGHIAAEAAVEAALRRDPTPMRHRLEHGGDVEALDRIERLAELGIIPIITPPQQRNTQARATPRTVPRYRSLVQAGVRPVAVSDATGTVPIFSPMGAIASLMASPEDGGGTPPGEELSFEEALRMHTIWAARAGFEERDKGSIAVGKLGDLAVLSADPTQLQGAEMFDVGVEATILGGEVVYER